MTGRDEYGRYVHDDGAVPARDLSVAVAEAMEAAAREHGWVADPPDQPPGARELFASLFTTPHDKDSSHD